MARKSPFIEDQEGAYYATRTKAGWLERLSNKAARQTGFTSGPIWQARYDSLFNIHKIDIFLEDVIFVPADNLTDTAGLTLFDTDNVALQDTKGTGFL